jgi:hypothetical protein
MRAKACGYIARAKSGACAVIMIAENGKKKYYVAEIGDVIDALTGKAPYAKISKLGG